jgi:hypothetical protein
MTADTLLTARAQPGSSKAAPFIDDPGSPVSVVRHPSSHEPSMYRVYSLLTHPHEYVERCQLHDHDAAICLHSIISICYVTNVQMYYMIMCYQRHMLLTSDAHTLCRLGYSHIK